MLKSNLINLFRKYNKKFKSTIILLLSLLIYSCDKKDGSGTVVSDEEAGQEDKLAIDDTNIDDNDELVQDENMQDEDLSSSNDISDENPQSMNDENEEDTSDQNSNEDKSTMESNTASKSSVRAFINRIYKSKVLFQMKCDCFTDGGFVIEDNDGRLYELLTKGCTKTRSITQKLGSSYQEGAINDISMYHYYTKLRRNPILCGTFDIDDKSWKSKRMSLDSKDTGPLMKFKRYEYELGCPIDNLCDSETVMKPSKCETKCKPKKCEPKKCEPKCKPKKSCKKPKNPIRVIEFFRFKTRPWSKCAAMKPDKCDKDKCKPKKGYPKNDSNTNRTYIYISLKKDRKGSMGNIGDTISPFKKRHNTRRESEKLKVDLLSEKNRLLKNIDNDDERNRASKSIKFYNDKLRTGNEYFVPEAVKNILLDGIN